MTAKNRFPQITILLIALIALSACAPRVATTPTVAPAPSATTPTAAPAPSATATTVLPVTGQNPGLQFEGLSSGLDNTKQARIRAISLVMGAPNTDVYVNGKPAFNGGVALQNINAGAYSGWLYVTPGTYTVGLVPKGGTINQALFVPADVEVVAGHRYTVAAIGQLVDKDIHPLIVDETKLEAGLGAGPSDSITIDINNLKGAESITEQAYGKTMAANIKYGEARAMFCASGSPLFATLANNQTSKVIVQGTFWAEPGTSFGAPWFGPYPADNYDSVDNISQGTSELNVIDFLAGFDGRDVTIDGHPVTFNTLVTAIEKAGLHDELVNSGPYFLMVPTDAAFDEMPQSERDTLLADPQALKKLFDAHIVDGYYPYGSLSGSTYGVSQRTVKNRLGQDLKFDGETLYGLHGFGYQLGPNYTVGNGNRLQIIYKLLVYK